MRARTSVPALARAPRIERACRALIGGVDRVDRLDGGNVSFVYRLWGERGTLVLKVRSDRFARIPELATSAALVAVEAGALEAFGSCLPEAFPHVVAVNPEQGLLLLTDLGPAARPLTDEWSADGPTCREAALLGAAVGRLHAATAGYREPLRPEGEEQVRRHLAEYCLREFGHPALMAAADRCAAELGAPVHGDLAPKNLLLRDGRILICDLENAHHGSRALELAYVAAHVLLHCRPDPGRMLSRLDSTLDAYTVRVPRAADPRRDGYAVTLLVGVLLYRLVNSLVDYPLPHYAGRREVTAAALLATLDAGPAALTAVSRALAGAGRRPAEVHW